MYKNTNLRVLLITFFSMEHIRTNTRAHAHTANSATHLPVCTNGKDTPSVLKLPCDATAAKYCYWTPVKTDTETTGSNTLQVDIPCGLKDHTILVVIGTVSMTVLGTLYLAYAATTVQTR